MFQKKSGGKKPGDAHHVMKNQNGLSNGEKNDEGLKFSYWHVCIPSVLALLMLIAITNEWIKLPENDPGGILTVIVGVVLLPWLAPIFSKMKIGALELEVRKFRDDVSEKIDGMQKMTSQLRQVDQALAAGGTAETMYAGAAAEPKHKVRDVFRDILDKHEQHHILNLMDPGKPVPYTVVHDALKHELERLLAFNLIARKPGKGQRTLFRDRDDINNHFELTPRGKEVAEALTDET